MPPNKKGKEMKIHLKYSIGPLGITISRKHYLGGIFS